MIHWRDVKIWIIDNPLFWWPWVLPFWSVDYLVLGLVYTRSQTTAIFVLAREEAGSLNFSALRDLPYSSYLHVLRRLIIMFIPLFVGILIMVLIWPAILLAYAIEFYRGKGVLSEKKAALFYETVWQLCLSALWFLPILFFCSKLLEKLGLVV